MGSNGLQSALAATSQASPTDVSGIYRQGKDNELRVVSIDAKTLDVHYCGTYPTANGQGSAWFYNFGKGGQAVNRHRQGNKQMAVSVRCIKE